MRRSLLASCVLGISTLCQSWTTMARGEVQIGDQVASFGFKDVWFLRRTLDDLPEHKLCVLAFGTVDCPVAQAALPSLKQLETQFAPRGVQFVLVNAGSRDSLRAWSAACLEHEIRFPLVKDFTGECVQALGITRSGEVAVLDADRRLRFRGRIDDADPAEDSSQPAQRQELAAALEALLTDQNPDIVSTVSSGALLADVAAMADLGSHAVNYADHIAPLMEKHCERCHHPNTEAPFSLMSFDEVAAHAETIAEVVHEERMPPWFASFGQFHDPPVMTWEEKQTIRAWVAAGCPPGIARATQAVATAPPKDEPVKWSIGEPDLVIKAPAAHKLPADGYVPYKYVLLPYRFPHDTWIQQCEILPDNPRVVHHCNMAYLESALEWNGAKFVLGKVPGVQPMDLTEGVAFRIPKGATLILQIHYTTTGQPEACQISVGMRFAREVVQRELRFLWMVNTQFAIPPGDGFHRVEANNTLEHDALVFGMFAHMHFRGRDMTFIAHPPQGEAERLLTIPNYSFDWQLAYRLADVRRFPKGTRVECISHYDNSTFNPFNPDAKATVREGQQTYQEMLNGVMFYLAEDERLNLRIDPKTGAVLDQAASKPQAAAGAGG